MAWLEARSGLPSGAPVVRVCIPHWGSVSFEFVRSMYVPLEMPQPDFSKYMLLMRGILNLDTERNELVKQALEDKKTTHVLFVDTDIVPETPTDPNQAIRMLLATNAPIVSGLYRAKQTTGFWHAMWSKIPNVPVEQGYSPIQSWTGNWITVDAIGMGFCLIKREVFEKVPYPWFEWKRKEGPSEDFAFCQKAKEAGYEIKVLTDIRLSHIGTLKVKTAPLKERCPHCGKEFESTTPEIRMLDV